MSHIVLKGKNTVEDIFKGLKQIFIKNENSLLRTLEYILNAAKTQC